MSKNPANSIAHYIDRVCKDAAESLNKPNDVAWQFCIVEDCVLFSMKSIYITVKSRILYRLANNFSKHFHNLKFKFIPYETIDARMVLWNNFPEEVGGFRAYPLRDGISPNFGFAYWSLFGKDVSLEAFEPQYQHLISADAGKKGTIVENKHFENFVKMYGSISYGVDTHSWKKYASDYKKIYGMDPYEIDMTYTNYEVPNNDKFSRIIV